MFYRNEVISYLQTNKILALKLDRALTGVEKAVSNQIESIGVGAMRMLYYTSCFTDEYQDVCQQQKNEDLRFKQGVIHLLRHGNLVYDLLKYILNKYSNLKPTINWNTLKKSLWRLISILPPVH